jgi:uncharacterized protein (DUF1501 family)
VRSAGDRALFDLGVGFGLHPAFAPLLPLWRSRELGIIHAVGLPEPKRSHFEAQELLETGTLGSERSPTGWLNRVSGLLDTEPSPFRSLAMSRTLPRSLHGPAPAQAIADLEELRNWPRFATGQRRYLENLYRLLSGVIPRANVPEVIGALSKLDPTRHRPARGALYPRSQLGRSLRRIALLIKADVGLEIATAESKGWDTHIQQGTTRGIFARRASDLARSLAAFWSDLGAHREDVLVLTVTEFGRALRENNSDGTDHGHGSCYFVLGNRVDGGKVHGSFPDPRTAGLSEERALPVTTDFRSVLSEVAGKHLGLSDPRVIFPGWSGPELPLLGRA